MNMLNKVVKFLIILDIIVLFMLCILGIWQLINVILMGKLALTFALILTILIVALGYLEEW